MRAKKFVRFGMAGLVAASMAASMLATAPAALANDGVDKRGSCSGNADWKLRLRPEDGGRLQVEFEVEHAKPGSAWTVKLSDNGTQFFQGSRTANSLGEFEVRRFTDNRAGTDTVRARATNNASGQVCSGSASIG
jgi:hypothetical protein